MGYVRKITYHYLCGRRGPLLGSLSRSHVTTSVAFYIYELCSYSRNVLKRDTERSGASWREI